MFRRLLSRKKEVPTFRHRGAETRAEIAGRMMACADKLDDGDLVSVISTMVADRNMAEDMLAMLILRLDMHRRRGYPTLDKADPR